MGVVQATSEPSPCLAPSVCLSVCPLSVCVSLVWMTSPPFIGQGKAVGGLISTDLALMKDTPGQQYELAATSPWTGFPLLRTQPFLLLAEIKSWVRTFHLSCRTELFVSIQEGANTNPKYFPFARRRLVAASNASSGCHADPCLYFPATHMASIFI